MWYEILPTFIIITTALSVPNLFAYFSNKAVLGQPYRRTLATSRDAYMYLRDARLSDRMWAYDYKGLENIPDTEESKNQSGSEDDLVCYLNKKKASS